MISRWKTKTSPMLLHYMAMTAILLSETLGDGNELEFHLDAMDAAWWRLTPEQREWVSEMSPVLTMLQEAHGADHEGVPAGSRL